VLERGLRVAAGVATGESVRAALAAFAADSVGNVFPARCSLYNAPTSQLVELAISDEEAIACMQSLRDIAERAGLICR
jgi:hypothetical protein